MIPMCRSAVLYVQGQGHQYARQVKCMVWILCNGLPENTLPLRLCILGRLNHINVHLISTGPERSVWSRSLPGQIALMSIMNLMQQINGEHYTYLNCFAHIGYLVGIFVG